MEFGPVHIFLITFTHLVSDDDLDSNQYHFIAFNSIHQYFSFILNFTRFIPPVFQFENLKETLQELLQLKMNHQF
jgi:hypothetical protein